MNSISTKVIQHAVELLEYMMSDVEERIEEFDVSKIDIGDYDSLNVRKTQTNLVVVPVINDSEFASLNEEYENILVRDSNFDRRIRNEYGIGINTLGYSCGYGGVDGHDRLKKDYGERYKKWVEINLNCGFELDSFIPSRSNSYEILSADVVFPGIRKLGEKFKAQKVLDELRALLHAFPGSEERIEISLEQAIEIGKIISYLEDSVPVEPNLERISERIKKSYNQELSYIQMRKKFLRKRIIYMKTKLDILEGEVEKDSNPKVSTPKKKWFWSFFL